ncbi:hypothetical protein BJX99DRAFT_272758 [Aspergillus californicus]
MSPPTPNASTTEFPIIDISPFLDPGDDRPEKRALVLDSIRSACLDKGFFLVTGHGVPRKLQEDALKLSEKFFALPLEEKLELSERNAFGKSHRGYQQIGGEAYEHLKLPDLKEGFQIGIHKDPSHPACVAQRMLTGPNVWPSSLEPGFSSCMLEYFDAVRKVTKAIFKILALSLDIDFDQYFAPICQDSLEGLRLLHYPPQALDASEDQLGTGAHTDFGLVTCLLTDENPGLQVLDNGMWKDVQPVQDAFIMNLGDLFTKLTAGVYKSSLHRVINRSPVHRFSIPCFLDGNLDAVIRSVVDGPRPDTRGMTVEEHMLERFTTVRDRVKLPLYSQIMDTRNGSTGME